MALSPCYVGCMTENNTTHKAEGLGSRENQTAETRQNGSVPQFQNETHQRSEVRIRRDSRVPERRAAILEWLRKQPLNERPNWQRLGHRAISDGLFARSTG